MNRLRRYCPKSDRQLVGDILANKDGAVHYLFFVRFREMLRLNAAKAAPGLPVDDLVQELYLYLSAGQWRRLRRYNPALPLDRWLSVVSFRFFKDLSRSMTDWHLQIPIPNIEDLLVPEAKATTMSTTMMDIRLCLHTMKSARDREVLTALLLRDEEPHAVAARLGVTVDNLYNIKRRALARLAQKHLS